MTIRQGLLALLADEPMYGARLRSEFEERTGGTWPLNVGQVYTTLGRLERDGLVEPAAGADDEGRIAYRITDLGRGEVDRWWSAPVDRDGTPRSELAIKVAMAVTTPGVDALAVVHRQRAATMTRLRDLTRRKMNASEALDALVAAPDDASELGWLLVLENLVFAAEAEVRWLDQVEARLSRHATRPTTPTSQSA